MAVNKYKPHLLILPEDGANQQLAVGAILHPGVRDNVIDVLRPARGWSALVDLFETEHIATMRNLPHRRLILLLDFDDQEGRRANIQSRIPADLMERVFVLGVRSEPERLRQALNLSYEKIGTALAGECRASAKYEIWAHELLQDNADEVSRLRQSLGGDFCQD